MRGTCSSSSTGTRYPSSCSSHTGLASRAQQFATQLPNACLLCDPFLQLSCSLTQHACLYHPLVASQVLCSHSCHRVPQERTVAQITGQQHDMESVSERVRRLENDLRKQTELVEQFKAVQNWNQEELQRWADAALQKEEDALTLALYQRQDDNKVKELNRQLERWAQGCRACAALDAVSLSCGHVAAHACSVMNLGDSSQQSVCAFAHAAQEPDMLEQAS